MLPRWLVISRIRTIFLNIPAIVQKAGVELCDPLPGLNAFTGCDTTSPFAGKGKRGSHKFCVNDKECHRAMAALGRLFALEASTFKKSEKSVCKLHESILNAFGVYI